MIEILDPRKIYPSPLVEKISAGWHYPLDYSWILATLREFVVPGRDVRILDVGSSFSQLSLVLEKRGYSVETMDRTPDGLHHHKGEFLEYDFSDVEMFDVVLWASSIEHQENMDDIHACYKKSLDLLAPGGVFMATFPISVETVWFSPAFQWNLSKQDSMRTFEDDVIRGNYQKIWEFYRENPHDLRSRYVGRFGQWDIDDPVYIAGAVVQVK